MKLQEMPHILLPNGKAVDLELEDKSKWKESDLLKYIVGLINGKEFSTRYDTKYRIDPSNRNDFIKILKNNMALELFFKKNYGESSWNRLVKYLERM
jgi:hypothetical protein